MAESILAQFKTSMATAEAITMAERAMPLPNEPIIAIMVELTKQLGWLVDMAQIIVDALCQDEVDGTCKTSVSRMALKIPDVCIDDGVLRDDMQRAIKQWIMFCRTDMVRLSIAVSNDVLSCSARQAFFDGSLFQARDLQSKLATYMTSRSEIHAMIRKSDETDQMQMYTGAVVRVLQDLPNILTMAAPETMLKRYWSGPVLDRLIVALTSLHNQLEPARNYLKRRREEHQEAYGALNGRKPAPAQDIDGPDRKRPRIANE
jgi:hypothetical protein